MRVASMHRRRDAADRVSAYDMSNLRIEEQGLSMHLAALAFLAGAPLRDASGALRLDEIRGHVEERIRGAERLHQVLDRPSAGRRAPAWVRDPHFDIARHVTTRTVPPPGDEGAVLELCCELTAPPLDRSRPLWELRLLDGLADGRVALLLRLHHVVADGAGALELFSTLFGPATPPPAPTDPVAAEPSRPPDRHVGPPPAPADRTRSLASGGAARLSRTWTLARLGRAPALSWNRPVGSRRIHLLVRGDLARAKATAHQQGGKVNDVVLAAVAGGAHRLLASRGELEPGLDLHVSVAASVRRPGQIGGNRVGVRVVAVPVDDPDATSRLHTISTRTAAQRHHPPLQPNGRFLQRGMVRIMKHQRLINLVLSNMPGPPAPLWFAGARVEEAFQLTPLQGNCPLGVAVLSYAGQLNVDIAADPGIVPDADVFARGVAETLDRLGAART